MAVDTEKLMNDMLAAWNSHDVAKSLFFYTDDCVYEDLGVGIVKRGKREIGDFFQEFFSGFPDVAFEPKGLVFSPVRSSLEWVMTGTHSCDLPRLPATGKTISVRGVSVVEFKGEKISRHSDYYDGATLWRQLGVQPRAPQG